MMKIVPTQAAVAEAEPRASGTAAAAAAADGASLGADGVASTPPPDRLAAVHNRAAAWAHASRRGGPTMLQTSPSRAAAIARGEHQIRIVDGRELAEPSQRLDMIESANPFEHGQTHVGAKHVGDTMQDDVARLQREPNIPAAGGFRDAASAQAAVDETIANPANQRFIGDFLGDPTRYKDVLERVDLGRPIGDDVLRRDLKAGHPQLRPATTADVVIIKDPSFPERYRVLTAYPDASRRPQVDTQGNSL